MERAPRRPKTPRPCPRCKTEFTPYDHRLLYCSTVCARAARSEHYDAVRPAECCEPGCTNPRKTNRTPRCARCTYARWPGDLEKAKARARRKTHIRKARTRRADVSTDYERQLRDKAKRCPICDVRLSPAPYQPTSKELDHIVPLNVGGTHTIGNVRIICRSCNLKRPRDGSDYTGPVTLFALEVA